MCKCTCTCTRTCLVSGYCCLVGYIGERFGGFINYPVIPFIKEDSENFILCFSRSQKAELHHEGYILELDHCSSLEHLADQKLIPEFIKKVSTTVRPEN